MLPISVFFELSAPTKLYPDRLSVGSQSQKSGSIYVSEMQIISNLY